MPRTSAGRHATAAVEPLASRMQNGTHERAPEWPFIVSGPVSWASSQASRNVMLANKSRDTQPELAVRRILHAHGLRYRVDARPEQTLRRRADIVFTRKRIAIFIDGCFWHKCPDHYVAPKTNADFWRSKITSNARRDEETSEILEHCGWTVLRYWCHEDPKLVAAMIESIVRETRV